MPWRVSRRADGRDARQHFFVPIISCDPLQDLTAEDAAVVFEQPLHTTLRSAVHLPVVHPKLVLDCWDLDLRIREAGLALTVEQTVDVVAVVVRDNDGV